MNGRGNGLVESGMRRTKWKHAFILERSKGKKKKMVIPLLSISKLCSLSRKRVLLFCGSVVTCPSS